MSSLHDSSSLSRTRSTRTPINTLKPAQNPSSRAISSSTTSSVSTVAAPSTITTTAPTAASNISLFLTNLRLLDLDLHPNWPDITTLTFTTKDSVAQAAGGQKKRIQCVEWALYHLFALWDHDEARNKLRPFFPPLDQVQSLNLRAALLRCLEQAKKNGVLGRDAVVRKTMLDECRGERLAEVLAVFSSAVLKKLVAEQHLNDPTGTALVQTLALENRGYTGERSELTALILAHRVSLCRALEEKNAARARFSEFSDLLRYKERTIARRREEVELAAKKTGGPDISDDLKLDIWRTVRNNWSGNECWMEALLYGDSHARKDGLLSAPLDRVWRRVQSGRLAELEDKSAGGLLEQLDGRVQSQRQRLEKWHSFRQEMFARTGPPGSAVKESGEARQRQRGIDLGFRAHENLHLGRMSPRKLARTRPGELHGEYQELIDSLEAQLTSISRNDAQVLSFFQRPTPRVGRVQDSTEATSPEPEFISELSDLEDEPHVSSQPPPQPELAFEQPILRRNRTFKERLSPNGGEHEPAPSSQLRRSATIETRHSTLNGRARRANGSPTRSPERRPSPPPPLSPLRSPPRPTKAVASPERIVTTPSPERVAAQVSPTQQLADQILASIEAASPSPVKKPRHTLSLAERTRLSMVARRNSQVALLKDEDEEADSELDRLPIKRMPMPTISQQGQDDEHEDYEDLVARTRRSMAGFETARQKAQLERRRSQRKSRHVQQTGAGAGRNSSYFSTSTVDELDEEEGDLTTAMDSTLVITEELLSGEGQNDYEAVFMSRPKIKTSPVGTPTRTLSLWDE
ncbi:HAUS augmin-like complex subunit 6 N-terminus-domain-containing protein [Apodospora peruviana]|uniref:HAUS augmin-like complex subunit 6 N-terminus-domain-containing protein n=1 Tax=Apodospora peruviana TaxID=516989 RepID=A0AAE0I4K2_9PEZI|nr:HAUS augmin-like complex subunit 6 N-terminus-domain-containing protein [Apodospora peruviana]